MGLEITRLHLVSPLYYLRNEEINRNNTGRGNLGDNTTDPVGSAGPSGSGPGSLIDPFSYHVEMGEMLFHFELEPNQSRSIEPDGEVLLSALIAGGRAAGPEEISPEKALVLPRGTYLFSQVKEILGRQDIISLAVEVQKEGLWQRLLPGKELYLRYLFEDRRGVTQVFRPYTGL
jgi:hypothetical protein